MLRREGSPYSRDDLRHDHELKWALKNARISYHEIEKLVIKGATFEGGAEISVPALAPVGGAGENSAASDRPGPNLKQWVAVIDSSQRETLCARNYAGEGQAA